MSAFSLQPGVYKSLLTLKSDESSPASTDIHLLSARVGIPYTDPKPMGTPVRIAWLLVVCAAMSYGQTSASAPQSSPKMTPKLTPEAVHRSATVIDTHADTPQRFLDENYDLGQPLNGGNLKLDSARKGNLGAEFFSIWVEPNINKGHYAKKTLELIDSVKHQAATHPDQMMFV